LKRRYREKKEERGNGCFVKDGAAWEKQRILSMAFMSAGIRQFADKIAQAA